MSSKMNWDRVRKESLVQRHGSERACNEPDDVFLKGPSPRPLMPGCTCGKRVGFKGSHKVHCKLFRGPVSTSTEAGPFTLRRFAVAMNGIGQEQAMRNLLAGFLEMLANDMTSTDQQKRCALLAVRALLKELDEEKAKPQVVAAA